jgi:endoglucanase
LKKLGNNNPMQIKSNPGYDRILAYWSGRGPEPGEEEAYTGVMKLAESARLENTMIKKDVIDAMFRQPHFSSSIPFRANMITNGTVLNSVDYDLGRNGIAYYDKDTATYHVSTGKREQWNRGNAYRNDGVDIRPDSTSATSYYISDIEDGEWLQYTLNVMKTGIYNLKFNCIAKKQEGKFSVLVNKNSPAIIDIPMNNNWKTIEMKNIKLNKGENRLRLVAEHGGFDFRSIEFVNAE